MKGLIWMSATLLWAPPQTNDQQLFQRAMQKLGTSDLRGATADFEQLRQRTGRKEFNYYLGICRAKLGEYEAALDHFEVALEERPDSWQTHLGLGEARFNLDRLESAAAAFRRTLELRPSTAEAHYHLGLIEVRHGDCAKAFPHFEATVAESPHHLGAAYNLAVCAGRLGRREEARRWSDRHGRLSALTDRIESLRKAASFPSSTAANWLDLGSALLEIEDWPGARSAYRRALEMSGADEIHYYLGFALYREGQTEEAIGHYLRFLEKAPENHQGHYNLGLAYRRAGRAADALAAFGAASRLAPSEPFLRVPAIEMALAVQESAEAAKSARLLTQDFPSFAHGHYLLSQALAQLGRTQEALSAAQAALSIEPANGLFQEWSEQLTGSKDGR